MKNNILVYSDKIKLSLIAKKLDLSKSKTLFIISKKKQLIGVLTDGDLRRSIFKYSDLKINLGEIMNKNPVAISYDENSSYDKILFLFHNYDLKAIPIISKNMTIKKIIHLLDFNKKKFTSVSKIFANVDAVIMAGGLGTRMKPFTEILPKPLIPINGSPIINKITSNFQKLNIKKIYISINKNSKILKAFFDGNENKKLIQFVEESKPLGTIGSLQLIENKISNNFFISNCDTIIKADYYDIYEKHIKNKNFLTIVSCKFNDEIPYGICNIKNNNQLINIIEKPKQIYLANTGFYIAKKEIIELIPKNKKFDMNILIKNLLKNKYKIGVYSINPDQWVDVGNWGEYNKIKNKNEN